MSREVDRPALRPRQRAIGPTDARLPTPRRRHGLTPAQQDALRAAQDGRCALCGRSGVLLVLDHDHQLAELHRHRGREGCPRCLRGMTCTPCNRALGLVTGHDRRVDRLVDYLMRTRR